MSENQVVALSAVLIVGYLCKLDHKIWIYMTRSLISKFSEDQFGAFREAWFDFNLLYLGLSDTSSGIVLYDLSLVLDLFDRAIVQFLQSTVYRDDNVARCTSTWLIYRTKTVCKDAWLGVSAIYSPIIFNEFGRL